MKQITLLAVIIISAAAAAFGQISYNEEQFRVFDAKGNPATLPDIIRAAGDNEAVFLGEQHDDAVAHAIELEIFKRIVAKYADTRKVGLSLEMFERDVQIVVDEYLSGLISENHFLLSSRPWANYKTDYRPLVELAKEKKLPVVAANAPRRYVNMVSRGGRDALKPLSKTAKLWLAPLPYGEPSAVYAAKFKELMKGAPEAQTDINKILASQSLWDATMSNSVATFLKKNKKALAVHLNGGFHTESRLGTIEHLFKYRPKAKAIVVTMKTETNFRTFDPAKHAGLGDFVILTAPQPKPGGTNVISEILRRIDLHRISLKTLKAQATMTTHSAQSNTTDTLNGSVNFLAPDGSRRHYLRVDWSKPDETFVMIDENFQVYRPRLNTVYEGEVGPATGDGMSQALAFMTMSREQIESNYIVVSLGEGQTTGGVRCWRLELTPKTQPRYRSAEIWVDTDGMPRQAKINKQNGDSATVLLSNIVKNAIVDANVFRLQMPPNVKRIRI